MAGAHHYTSIETLRYYQESEEFLKSPRYEEYARHAYSVAKRKLKIFKGNRWKHNDDFKERYDDVFYNICAIELMQFEYKEQNAFFNAHWDHAFNANNPLPDIDYLHKYVDEQIDELCEWGSNNYYE